MKNKIKQGEGKRKIEEIEMFSVESKNFPSCKKDNSLSRKLFSKENLRKTANQIII